MLKFLHLFAVFRIVSFAIVQEYGKPLKIILLFIAIWSNYWSLFHHWEDF